MDACTLWMSKSGLAEPNGSVSVARGAAMRVFRWIGAGLLGVAATVAMALPASASGVKMSQSEAAGSLSAVGITWSSSGGCTTRSNPHCTSFEQINSGTVNGVRTLKTASGCAVNITGGTEVGHASGTYSHYNGYKVDVGHNGCLDGYVLSAFTRIADRGDGYPQWRSAAGNVYCDEVSHWDITYF
jgi:hypothetical protein